MRGENTRSQNVKLPATKQAMLILYTVYSV